MSFLGGLFKKKAGGTTFGNILRGVTSNFSGGAIGSGQDLLKWEMENGYRDSYGNPTAKYYTEILNQPPPSPAVQTALTGAMAGLASDPNMQVQASIFSLEWIKAKIGWILLAILGLWVLVRKRTSVTVNNSGGNPYQTKKRK